ncbi:hypothetical protein [Peribacillus frigoritolerans]|uniref:hypothetical protein n=1 Tax=Peribacillus frigoritolerans TaxID=450367 RepID=UPI002E221A1B|nr:hypothetical protein [Peribacillus frigoritolerans]
MERKSTGEKYNNEFKPIVGLYHSGNSVKELSGEYGAYQKLPWYKCVKGIYSSRFRGRVHDTKGISRHSEGKPLVKARS